MHFDSLLTRYPSSLEIPRASPLVLETTSDERLISVQLKSATIQRSRYALRMATENQFFTEKKAKKQFDRKVQLR